MFAEQRAMVVSVAKKPRCLFSCDRANFDKRSLLMGVRCEARIQSPTRNSTTDRKYESTPTSIKRYSQTSNEGFPAVTRLVASTVTRSGPRAFPRPALGLSLLPSAATLESSFYLPMIQRQDTVKSDQERSHDSGIAKQSATASISVLFLVTLRSAGAYAQCPQPSDSRALMYGTAQALGALTTKVAYQREQLPFCFVCKKLL